MSVSFDGFDDARKPKIFPWNLTWIGRATR